MFRRYNPLEEDRYTVGEFLDYAVEHGWQREDIARQLYSMIALGNVTGTYHLTLRTAMEQFGNESV